MKWVRAWRHQGRGSVCGIDNLGAVKVSVRGRGGGCVQQEGLQAQVFLQSITVRGTHLLVLRTNMAWEDMVNKALFFMRNVCTCPSHGEAGWDSHVLNANI